MVSWLLTGAPEQRYWQNRETANVGLDSSVGRAPARQSGGRRFKSRSSHFSLFIQIYHNNQFKDIKVKNQALAGTNIAASRKCFNRNCPTCMKVSLQLVLNKSQMTCIKSLFIYLFFFYLTINFYKNKIKIKEKNLGTILGKKRKFFADSPHFLLWLANLDVSVPLNSPQMMSVKKRKYYKW